jgi:ribosomal protein S18 acetylase RimI-like enzyme
MFARLCTPNVAEQEKFGATGFDNRRPPALSIFHARPATRDLPPMHGLVKLRPVRDEDEPFLRLLRAQADAERLGLHNWPPEAEGAAAALLGTQFAAHAAHFRKLKSNWDAKDCVIEFDGMPVGRFVVTQGAEEVRVSDITVAYEYRGRGLGQAVIDAVKAECVQSKRVLRLRVEASNPALQFYLALGFRAVEQTPVHFQMEWVPPTLIGRKQYFSPGGG